MNEEQVPTTDKGRAWIILAASFWTTLTTISIQRASGMLFTAMMDVYGFSREEAAWPFFLWQTSSLCSAVILSFVSVYFSTSYRTQVLTGLMFCSVGMSTMFLANDFYSVTTLFGIVYGLGSGVIRFCNIMIITQFFNKYRTIALGIMFSGTSTGAFILPPLVEQLINYYGLRGSYLLLTGITLQGFIGGVVYSNISCVRSKGTEPVKVINGTLDIIEGINNTSQEIQLTIIGDKPLSRIYSNGGENNATSNKRARRCDKVMMLLKPVKQILQLPMFYIIWLTFTVYYISYHTLLVVLVDFGIDNGVEEYKAIYLISASSIAELFGRLGGGWIVDLEFISRRKGVITCFVVVGISFILISLVTDFIWILITTIILAFTGNCLFINYSSLYTDYVGLENRHLAYGLGIFFTGLVSSAHPMIIGLTRDSGSSYRPLFCAFGGMLLFCSILWCFEPFFLKFQPTISKETCVTIDNRSS